MNPKSTFYSYRKQKLKQNVTTSIIYLNYGMVFNLFYSII